MWNAANGVATVNGKEYKVLFSVTAEVVSEESALSHASANKQLNDFSMNFVRIEDGFSGPAQVYPNAKGTNSIIMSTSHVCDNATTAAHEYGHSLGHTKHEPYGQKIDGQPNIFSSRHNPVDAEYTMDPSQGPTQMTMKDGKIIPSSVVNPMDTGKREVTQKDINYLNLRNINIDAFGKANIGSIDNVIFDANGNRKN